MDFLIDAVNKTHVILGWISVALLILLFWRRKGDRFHRQLGKATILLTAFMSFLAIAFVSYRLFGGVKGPGGFSILGINKLIFPLYLFYTAYLLVRSNTDDESRTKAREHAIFAMVIAVIVGTTASIASGNRPYLTGRALYTLEINLTDFIVSIAVPFLFVYYDRHWKFQDFSRLERSNQHALRMVIGTVFLVYASAPWNYLTNWIYSTVAGPLGLGHVLLYSGSPFLALYLLFRFNSLVKNATLRFLKAIGLTRESI